MGVKNMKRIIKKIIRILIISIIISILIFVFKEIIQVIIYQLQIIESYYKELELRRVIKDSKDYTYEVYFISLIKKSMSYILKILIYIIKYINKYLDKYSIIKENKEIIFKQIGYIIDEIKGTTWNKKNIQIQTLNLVTYVIKLTIIITITILQYAYYSIIKIYYIIKIIYKLIKNDYEQILSYITYIIYKLYILFGKSLLIFYRWSVDNCPELNYNICLILKTIYTIKNMIRFVYVIMKHWEMLEEIDLDRIMYRITALIKYLMRR
jgi:hypothetical protein